MYVKAINGVVESYPYSIGNLRKDNPQVSFPKQPTNELLATWNVYPVELVDAPSADYTQNLKESEPIYIDGKWKQAWVVTPATVNEIASLEQSQAQNMRATRGELLAKSDWTQVADAPVDKAAWATYRQQLRDISAQESFPWSVVWPTAPTGV